MRVRNPAVNSLYGNIRIRQTLQYSDPPESGIKSESGIREHQVRISEKTIRMINSFRSLPSYVYYL